MGIGAALRETITLETLRRWLHAPTETEHLEFKEAKLHYDLQKAYEYCAAFANEGGGCFVLGVSDKQPRRVVGSRAFENTAKLKEQIFDKLGLRVEVHELEHPDGRVVVLEIPSRPQGLPVPLGGTYFMRVGESLQPMSPDQLRRIFAEGSVPVLEQPALDGLSSDEVIALLEVQSYFDLMRLPFPTDQSAVLQRLEKELLVQRRGDLYQISNLGAILLAKDLRQFQTLWRKAPRVIVYRGRNKIETVRDQTGGRGYAVSFDRLLEFINGQLPANEVIGGARREDIRVYPEIAIRELVANALIHQDFEETGSSVSVEIYSDRIEIGSPGKPLISKERFVDEYKSRNERLADVMRRLGLCEEKGSGIDKVIFATEVFQLPAPVFRISENRTTVVLFAPKEFSAMDSQDRVWACYLYCCLRYVGNEKMTNQSLRERFKLPDAKSETASRIIADAVEDGLIRGDDPESRSKRYARYVPFWA